MIKHRIKQRLGARLQVDLTDVELLVKGAGGRRQEAGGRRQEAGGREEETVTRDVQRRGLKLWTHQRFVSSTTHTVNTHGRRDGS